MIRLPKLVDFARSLRLAFRMLARHGGAWYPAIAILALGVGMSAAMYSLVDAVLLRPLPFPGQESIQVIWKKDPLAGNFVGELAYPELRDLQESIRDFRYVAVMPTSLYGYGKVLQTGAGEPLQIEGAPVSHDFFRVLGVAPAMGRDFAASDEQVGAAPVVIVSDRVWREQLGSDPHAAGRMIRLNGQGYTVIGVMGRGIEFPRGAGLWVPLGVDRGIVERRGATFLQAIARSQPGVLHKQIEVEVNALFTRLAAEHPEAYSRSQQGVVTTLAEYWTGSARVHLWIMLGASLLLLAAATISAGNLILSRTMSRRGEMAIRGALGGSRSRLLLQFAAEGMAAGTIAAAGGLAIASAMVGFLVRWAPADIPRLSQASLDLPGFCVAAGTAMTAALACSVVPGWFTTRGCMEAALRAGGGRVTHSRAGGRMQGAFLAAQAAVTVALLALAALLVLSYRAMITADTGFANRDAVSMNLALRGPGLFAGQAFDADTRRALYTRLLDRLREAPGVTSAAAILVRPLEGDIGWERAFQFEFEAGAKEQRELPKTNYEVVTPGYFETVGTPLLEGRDFDRRDTADAGAVAIVSRLLAQRIRQAGHDPVGHRLRFGASGEAWLKVVGVVGDARYRNITRSGTDIFVPYLQAAPPTNYVVIRGSRSAAELAALVRRTLASMDPNQAIAGVATLGELMDRNAARHRFNMMLLLWFAVCASVLSAAGVYSAVAENVAARRRETAIRSALGANRGRLVREMVGLALLAAAGGEAVGLACASGLGALATDLLYGVSPRDPAILGAVSAFLFVVSAAAAIVPAWLAAGADWREELRAG
jgi:putative ABC transport system permease protein